MPPQSSTRRTLLCAGAGILSLTAGCLTDFDDTDGPTDDDESATNERGDDTETDDETTDAADETDDDTDGDDTGLEYDIEQYSHSDLPEKPDVTLLTEQDETDDWLAARGLADSLEEFIAETVFEQSSLIALEAEAPTHCYELIVEEVSVGDESEDASDTLTLEAAVRDETDDDTMCAQALTAVGALVRVSIDGSPVTDLSARVTAADGTEHGVGLATASASESDSTE